MVAFTSSSDYQEQKAEADILLKGRALVEETEFYHDWEFQILVRRFEGELIQCHILRRSNGQLLVDILVNWPFFDCSEPIRHPDGNIYVLTNAGGNTLINLTDRHVTLCAGDGYGWDVVLNYSGKDMTFAVDSMVPGGAERVVYDFRTPNARPLPIIEHHPCNIVGTHPRYIKAREEMERFYTNQDEAAVTTVVFEEWTLSISQYKTERGAWSYSRGVVKKDGVVLADIKRNYPAFPYLFLRHPNGKAYLLCGEDYQGYTIVNLTDGEAKSFVSRDWLHGVGFCWADILGFDADRKTLSVAGCYWGAPYEIVEYDLSCPEWLPFRILRTRLMQDQTQDEEDDD